MLPQPNCLTVPSWFNSNEVRSFEQNQQQIIQDAAADANLCIHGESLGRTGLGHVHRSSSDFPRSSVFNPFPDDKSPVEISSASIIQESWRQHKQPHADLLAGTMATASVNSSILPFQIKNPCPRPRPESMQKNITGFAVDMSIVTSGEASVSYGSGDDVDPINQAAARVRGRAEPPQAAPVGTGISQRAHIKKKRNLPGNPDPDAEVIALSPRTLLATNRFICEICNKGFPRDQNLQLHRRGHNLPWKLRQRSAKEVVRKRVYICPEPSCVHHDSSRALGDLSGIKKHFSRKHCEKKWKCGKCSKSYAVQSDWKAHMKICGTREYRCYCGTLFSRRDSFVTHRAFCDALIEENTRMCTSRLPVIGSDISILAGAGSSGLFRPSSGFDDLTSATNNLGSGPNLNPKLSLFGSTPVPCVFANETVNPNHGGQAPFLIQAPGGSLTLIDTVMDSKDALTIDQSKVSLPTNAAFNVGGFNFMHGDAESQSNSKATAVAANAQLYMTTANAQNTSATALLQKAAIMGATASGPSVFKNTGTMAPHNDQLSSLGNQMLSGKYNHLRQAYWSRSLSCNVGQTAAPNDPHRHHQESGKPTLDLLGVGGASAFMSHIQGAGMKFPSSFSTYSEPRKCAPWRAP